MADISWWRTSFGEAEIERIASSIRAEHVSQGAVTAEFEERLAAVLGVPHVIATTSGSTALLMALIACDVGPGDEVIIPNRTWIATAHAAMLLGAVPVLVDVIEDCPIIDPEAIEPLITPRTRVIMPVHLNGRSADMQSINGLARKHGLRVVEDAAQALGSRNAHGMLGTQSDVGCFSLSIAKIIATGQGGYLATRDRRVAEKLLNMRTHGVSDVINATYTTLGFNFRFNDVLASIGVAQLDRLPGRIERVKEIYGLYRDGLADLPGVRLIEADLAAGQIPIYIEVLCEDREQTVRFLRDKGIQTRPFYPDLDTAPHLRTDRSFPRSRRFGKHGLFLPSGGEQPKENVMRVIEALHESAKSCV